MANRAVLALLPAVLPMFLLSQTHFDWHASTHANLSTGTFAPYYIASNADGLYTQGFTLLERAGIEAGVPDGERFSWRVGIEGVADFASSASYERWDFTDNRLVDKNLRPSAIWLQQLWGKVRLRSVFLTAGMKTDDRSLFDSELGIGDVVMSRNARPIPQIRIGFENFVAVPFTKNLLWLRGEIAYGKFTDSGWLKNHYNYADHFLTTGVWFHHKSIYFSSPEEKSFRVILGMQHAAQFGGNQQYWMDGTMTFSDGGGVRLRDFFDIFVPLRNGTGHTEGDRAYYNGNHLGSWDIIMSFNHESAGRFQLSAQLPWEDGSGIGKLNGWDGVWSASWSPKSGPLDRIEITYIDFTNQSGPIHWAPSVHPDSGVPGEATGSDDYYNNYFYDGWTNYGMAIGTPFLRSPIYNQNGYLRFADNRVRGFQLGVSGDGGQVSWRGLMSWRRSWGTPYVPRVERKEAFCAMGEVSWSSERVKGLTIKGQLAFDAGSLYRAGVGVMASAEYRGSFNIKRK